MKNTEDTKWRLIEWGVYIASSLLGIAIITFAVSALIVTWKYTHHAFFWWTIPQGITAAFVVVCGMIVAVAPIILGRLDKKFKYNK